MNFININFASGIYRFRSGLVEPCYRSAKKGVGAYIRTIAKLKKK